MPYPYVFQGRILGADNLLAQVPCVFQSGRGSSPTILVEVDTGAAISIAPAGLASDLGLELSSGRPVRLMGVGGVTLAYVHPLDLSIGGDLYPAVPVAITTDDSTPFLLGRIGFWSKVAMLFDGLSGTVTLTPLVQAAR